MSSSYKPELIIPEEVQRIIKAWCYKSHNTEWSGTLWYSVEGSFEAKDLKIICKDIYVSDIGTAGYTEFDVKPEIVSYMCEKPELLDCYMGLIHSHNNMATFFSGTDTATLQEEGECRAHFVSLIVNNAGVYTAKITRKMVEHLEGSLKQSYPTWGGETKEVGLTQVNEDNEYLEAYVLDITILEDKTLENSVTSRYNAIMEEKRKARAVTPYTGGYNPYGFGGSYGGGTPGFQGNKGSEGKGKGKAKKEEKEEKVGNIFKQAEEAGFYLKTEALKEIVYQLVTGSVASTGRGQNTPTAKDWVEKSMVPIFDRRFGSELTKFKSWLIPYLEFLLYESDPSCFDFDVDGYQDDELASLIAQDVISVVKEFKTNKYLETMIAELESYVYVQEEEEEKEDEANKGDTIEDREEDHNHFYHDDTDGD